ncbi:serine/threonine-protein kinase VPS15 isoform X1 [Silene latifolia]|uniref:serine/threonine-protein kinase VPS15 isoform X1 n=2 Tax=Silene latifolia TaxID=37657 RepID=UPI003D7800D7
MGNKIARTTQASATEYYLHDLPSSYNLVLKEVLGRGRFFKSIQCKHDEGLVIVKVYFKRGDQIDLRDYEKRLYLIRDTFRNIEHPHVWPFQFWLETDKAAYLLRQYFFNNLHDRLSTRPFLSLVEKKWLAFQLLCAVKQSHELGICHGDIKCENVLVTSWNWVYLADFASFKPTYIPDDDPSDFSFFFDTGGRRLCYLAPERFYEHGGDFPVAPDSTLKPSMDIFAAGCVIAELFLEGQPLFELSQLLAYRRGQHDPSQHLEKIPDPEIRKMILHMIQLNPDERLSAEDYLKSYAGVVFPNFFSPFLHNFYSCLNSLDIDARVVMCQSAFHEIVKQMASSKSGNEITSGPGLPSHSADKTSQQMVLKQVHSYPKSYSRNDPRTRGLAHERFELLGDLGALLRDVDHSNHFSSDKSAHEDTSKCQLSPNEQEYSIQSPSNLHQSISDVFKRQEHAYLKKITINDLKSLMSEYDSESDTYRMPFLQLPPDVISCEGMVLITSLLCSCIRNVKFPQLRRSCILLLKYSSIYIDNEDRLQRVLPYVVAMLNDSAAIVRCAALETVCDILPLVREFPPSDAKIFPEYILPMLSMVPDDPEESVRICYASNICKLALTSYGFLVHSIRLSESGVLEELSMPQKSLSPTTNNDQALKVYSNAQLAHLRKSIAEVVQELVMGPKQTPNIRRALLQDVAGLCCFFGQKQSIDFLLPILPAFLNDRDEQLRTVFYGQIVYVCFFIGPRNVEEYLVPYIEQALSDTTEGVIVNTLDCLTSLCNSGFIRKRVLLDMIQHAFPLLCYPSHWVRRSVVSFIAASSVSLGAVDSFVFLAPVIRPFLRRQPASLASEKALLSCLKPPVSRQGFYQILEDARGSDMLERHRKIWYNSSTPHKQWDPVDLPKQNDVWPDIHQDLQDPKFEHHIESIDCDSGDVKVRSVGGFVHNASTSVDIRDHLSPEKLQFSGLISPQLNNMNSLLHDRSPENIPLYSFSLDKRIGNSQAESDTSSKPNTPGIDPSTSNWLDQVNKPFGMTSSLPAPKLVSGSFSIASGSKQFHRVVHEPDPRESDQTSYMSSKFHELAMTGSLKGSSSSSIEDVSSSNDVTGASPVSWTSSHPDLGWKPRGVLVAHLPEHRSAVNAIAVSTDNSFFVSASDDSTVKVWDSRRLEKDISFRSRLTYPLEGTRALCTTMIRGSAQVIVGACDGRIHMFSVDYLSRGIRNGIEKYSGIANVKKREVGEGAILSLVNYSADASASHSVMYSTQNCGIHLWDTRTNTDSWTLKSFPEEGYVSNLVTDPSGNWFISGSSRGVLTLWDLRFLIPVNTWEYPCPCPIESMCLYVPPPNAPFSATRALVYVAAGCNEVSLWNAETGNCHQVFRVPGNDGDAELGDLPWALARPPNKSNPKSDPRRSVNSKYRVDELNEPPPRLSGFRTLLSLPGGDLLTGGTDLRIRRWDHDRPERSYCVCGPTIKGLGNDDTYDSKSSFGAQVVQETRKRPLHTKMTTKAVLAAAAVDPAGCHRDSILALASVKLNQRLLLSGSRDGAIKVWK